MCFSLYEPTKDFYAPQIFTFLASSLPPSPASAAINDFSTRLPRLADQVPLLTPYRRREKCRQIVISPSQSVFEGDFAFLQLFNIYDRSKK